MDSYTLNHLDAWLDNEMQPDAPREAIRDAMVATYSDDPEYWGNQSWWNVSDQADCRSIAA